MVVLLALATRLILTTTLFTVLKLVLRLERLTHLPEVTQFIRG